MPTMSSHPSVEQTSSEEVSLSGAFMVGQVPDDARALGAMLHAEITQPLVNFGRKVPLCTAL